MFWRRLVRGVVVGCVSLGLVGQALPAMADGGEKTPPSVSISVPADPFVAWDGKQGMSSAPLSATDKRIFAVLYGRAVDDSCASCDTELREAALKALVEPSIKSLTEYLRTTRPAIMARVKQREDEAFEAGKKQILADKAKYGQIFNARADEALSSNDPIRVKAFIAYGGRIAAETDALLARMDVDHIKVMRDRLAALAVLDSNAGRAAKAAMAGDDAAVKAFYEKGLIDAFKADDQAFKDLLTKIDQSTKEAVKASEKTLKASRTVDRFSQLEKIAELQDQVSVAAAAETVTITTVLRNLNGKYLSRRQAGVHDAIPDFDSARFETDNGTDRLKRHLATAVQTQGETGAIVSQLRADGVGGLDQITLNADAVVLQVQAAIEVEKTARLTADALEAADKASDSADQAVAAANLTVAWRAYVNQQEQAVTQSAVQAEKQAELAQAAAGRAEEARKDAENGKQTIAGLLEQIKGHRAEAERQQNIAAQQRAVAEQSESQAIANRDIARSKNQIAQAARAQATQARQNADAYAAVAKTLTGEATRARIDAESYATEAFIARDEAWSREDESRLAKAGASAFRAVESHAGSQQQADLAGQLASLSEHAANSASGAASESRAYANEATGAAAEGDAAATRAESAAAQARAAAANADAAARRAEQEAAAAERDAREADRVVAVVEVSAAQARSEQIQAAEHADTAREHVVKAQAAVSEALEGARQASQTAQATRDHAFWAAVHAGDTRELAGQVSVAAFAAARPADSSIKLVQPFNAARPKATERAAQLAKISAKELDDLARQAAANATEDEKRAGQAAKQATAEEKQAHESAYRAAGQLVRASKAMQTAYQAASAAAQSAAQAADALAIATSLNSQCQENSAAAGAAAGQARADANIAGRSAAQATQAAQQARSYADQAAVAAADAQAQADAAQRAAEQAQKDADQARQEAKRAQEAATRALEAAIDAQKAAADADRLLQVGEKEEIEKIEDGAQRVAEHNETSNLALVNTILTPVLKACFGDGIGDEAVEQIIRGIADWVATEGLDTLLDVLGIKNSVDCVKDVAAGHKTFDTLKKCGTALFDIAMFFIPGAKVEQAVFKLFSKTGRVFEKILHTPAIRKVVGSCQKSLGLQEFGGGGPAGVICDVLNNSAAECSKHDCDKTFKHSKPDSKTLGNNMVAAKQERPSETAAHHIVAGRSKRAQKAREHLERFEIDINDPANGVFLPKNLKSANPNGAAVHSKMHTKVYYERIDEMITECGTREEIIARLENIRGKLLKGESL